MDSLWTMSLLLVLDGGTLAIFTTPIVLRYGTLHEPWSVAIVGSAASAAGSACQLLLMRWFISSRHPWMERFTPSREKVEAAVQQYRSASFMAILLARATPMPDLPLKIVAAVVEYPVPLYMLAVLLGALPYFYALALLGRAFHVPNWVLIAAVAVIVLGVVIDRMRIRRRRSS